MFQYGIDAWEGVADKDGGGGWIPRDDNFEPEIQDCESAHTGASNYPGSRSIL